MRSRPYMLARRAYALVALSLLLPTAGLAATTEDEGKISELFAGEGGYIAIKLDNGFPRAIAAKHCGSNGRAWAGNVSASSSLKAALLSAKTTGSPVTVTINGCVNNGTWMKITGVYIR